MSVPTVTDIAPPPPVDDPSDEQESARPSAATKLVQLALSKYRLGVSVDRDAFAAPLDGARHVVRMLRDGTRGSLRSTLAADYFDKEGKTAPQQALTDPLRTLEDMAERCDPEPLSLRTAARGGSIWIDVGDAEGTVIEVNPTGWRFANDRDSIPLFRRTELTAPLPLPNHDGDLARLWDFLNVTKEDRPTLLAFLVAAFLPDEPHPILTFAGEQGTGKSTAARMLVSLVDPSAAPLRKPPRDADSFVTALSGSWVAAVDNISGISDWLSDSFCRAVTGDGDVRRKFYTDAGLSVFAFKRVIILTGIDFAGMRGDLTERMLMVNLRRIHDSERRDDRGLATDWEEARRPLFGALLDALSAVLATLPTIHLERSPRMADFARVVAALDRINGTAGLDRYAAQSVEIAADTLTANPFIARLTGLPVHFTGSAAELLARLTPPDPEWKPPRDWPKNARAATTLLKRHAPALRAQGWTVDDVGEDRTHTRLWRVDAPQPETLFDDPAEQ